MAPTHWFTAAILVAGLTAPALGQTGPPSTSPFRDSIAREAALLAGQTAKAPGATAQWSRVRSLQPGERIHVTLSAGPTLQRSFLAADDATITLLNDSNPALPEETGRDLRRLAATRPRSLLIIAMGGTLRLDRLRIDPRGAFLDGNRIGDVSIIVEFHSRDEIVEIALAEWRAPKRFWQYLLGWPGVVGLTGGVVAAAHGCETRRPCTVSDRAVAISGAVGAFASAFAARHMDRRTPDGIVYRRQSDAGTELREP
jgi:hypothetical protein